MGSKSDSMESDNATVTSDVIDIEKQETMPAAQSEVLKLESWKSLTRLQACDPLPNSTQSERSAKKSPKVRSCTHCYAGLASTLSRFLAENLDTDTTSSDEIFLWIPKPGGISR